MGLQVCLTGCAQPAAVLALLARPLGSRNLAQAPRHHPECTEYSRLTRRPPTCAKVPPIAAWMARGRPTARRCSSMMSWRRVKNSYASWCSLQGTTGGGQQPALSAHHGLAGGNDSQPPWGSLPAQF